MLSKLGYLNNFPVWDGKVKTGLDVLLVVRRGPWLIVEDAKWPWLCPGYVLWVFICSGECHGLAVRRPILHCPSPRMWSFMLELQAWTARLWPLRVSKSACSFKANLMGCREDILVSYKLSKLYFEFCSLRSTHTHTHTRNFPGGGGDKNPTANAGGMAWFQSLV